MYSLSLVEMHNFSVLLCLSPPWLIRVKHRERRRERGKKACVGCWWCNLKPTCGKGAGSFLCPSYTFFLFQINFSLAAGTPLKFPWCQERSLNWWWIIHSVILPVFLFPYSRVIILAYWYHSFNWSRILYASACSAAGHSDPSCDWGVQWRKEEACGR